MRNRFTSNLYPIIGASSDTRCCLKIGACIARDLEYKSAMFKIIKIKWQTYVWRNHTANSQLFIKENQNQICSSIRTMRGTWWRRSRECSPIAEIGVRPTTRRPIRTSPMEEAATLVREPPTTGRRMIRIVGMGREETDIGQPSDRNRTDHHTTRQNHRVGAIFRDSVHLRQPQKDRALQGTTDMEPIPSLPQQPCTSPVADPATTHMEPLAAIHTPPVEPPTANNASARIWSRPTALLDR